MRPAGYAILLATLLASTGVSEAVPNVSALFDPAALARNMCGSSQGAELQPAALPPPQTSKPPLLPGLGTLTYPVSTKKPEAQAYFDQGLRLMYAFNHGEAIAAFRAAQQIDPSCAMCFWGEAISLGPNINYRMADGAMLPALVAVARAVKNEAKASPKERALIEASRARYSADQKATREGLDDAYADAMAKVHADYPDDPDIATLFAEAAMDATHPWWLPSGRVANGRMADAVRALEGVLHAHPDHPGAIHYYVHVMEGSAWTKIAEPYADRLPALMPAAGHIVHMPAHIDFALGRYKDALAANLAAIADDEKYFDTVSAFDANYYGLFAHNLHFGLEAADMAGDAANALALAAKLRDSLPDDFLRSKFYAQRNLAAAYFAHLKFSTPDEILALPKPNDDFAFLMAVWHYTRGSAFAFKGDSAHAAEELKALEDLRNGPDIKAIAVTAQAVPRILDVAKAVLSARIAVAQHKPGDAIAPLQQAVAIEDDVGYAGDPPWWDNPLRQSLGVVLLKAGKPRAAVDTLRKALIVAPNDGTVLYALREASMAVGDRLGAEQYGKLFEKAWVGPKPPDLDRL